MTINFHPNDEKLFQAISIEQKLDILKEGAEEYKTAVLSPDAITQKCDIPRNLTDAFQWDIIAKLLGEIRNQSEGSIDAKLTKANGLEKLASIYTILREAKMPKLEAVRLALMQEASHLKQTSAQVA